MFLTYTMEAERFSLKKEKNESMKSVEIPNFIQYEEKNDLTNEEILLACEKTGRRYGLTEEESNDYEEYLHDLSLAQKDLIDKIILDIGSGQGNFKKSLIKMGIDQRNIAILDYVDFQKKEIDIRGLAETLPFKDKSFDLVLAHCSAPIMSTIANRYNLITPTIREAVRVTKKKGLVKVFPVGGYRTYFDDTNNKKRQKMFENVIKEIEKLHQEDNGFNFKITKIINGENPKNYDYSLEIERQ